MEREQERKRIGQRIAELRRANGMTQQEMAERCGIFQSNIARIEKGKYAVTVDILGRIADVLGMKVDFV